MMFFMELNGAKNLWMTLQPLRNVFETIEIKCRKQKRKQSNETNDKWMNKKLFITSITTTTIIIKREWNEVEIKESRHNWWGGNSCCFLSENVAAFWTMCCLFKVDGLRTLFSSFQYSHAGTGLSTFSTVTRAFRKESPRNPVRGPQTINWTRSG